MPSIPFGLLEEPETRKPSKARLALAVSFLVLLVLSIVFISLYAVEKNKSDSEGSSSKHKQPNGTATPSNTTSATTNRPTINSTTISPTNFTTASPTPPTKTCSTPACIVSAAEILNKLDQSTKPCDDFYQYSCGGFLKKNFIPDDKYHIDSFTAGNDFVQYTLRGLLQDEQLMSNYSVDPKSALYKAFVYYKSCMNDSNIESAGIKPILDVIEKHGSWNITNRNWNGDSWELEKVLARVLVDTQVPVFLGLDIQQSYFNTSEVFITISGGIIGFNERQLDKEQSRSREFTLKQKKAEGSDVYKDYRKFMSTIFQLLGANSTVDDEVKRIVNMEDKFLNMQKSLNGSNFKLDNISLMTIDELNNLTSFKFNWTTYFDEALNGTSESIKPGQKIMVLLPNNIKDIVDWLEKQPKSLLANEITWSIIQSTINNLPKAFRGAREKYYKSLKIKLTPRWKACNALTNRFFTHVTTLLYVNGHLSEDARNRTAEMFDEVKDQFIAGLSELNWMDNATRAQAQLKLKKMRDWIGFPLFIKNTTKLNSYYSNVQVDVSHLLRNSLNVLKDQSVKKINELGKPPDDGRFSMPPLTINAYYNARANGMTILAGILQAPFYKGGRLKALNYGSLGMVVGHEITHGFDKTGSQFDENGNYRQWWTKASHENFVKRSQCLIDQYNNITIFGQKVDGKKTLSENIADNGGLKYAFRAYQKWRETNGDEDRLPALPFDNNQLFFVSFAQLWCAKYGKGSVKSLMLVDDHSLDPVRVRVPLHNFPEFSEAFGCRKPNKTCAVW
ncbi:endothelin-converting enzyme homolog isoform X2 [Dendronephthya gigantea]|uniref:endothelin-converting enzyme homolog isoform X2 n=1 Tax=Dendronephthya gigantea TaxID=151771 RepID=UPI0010692D6B|nr:endothelin-converting enzyme homolog isoform X2 [Dendronephthya gigantea]